MKGGLPSPSRSQLRTVQVGAPSTGPASCLAEPKRKPPRGVPTEPEGVRSSSPRVSGQCKGHQVSIVRARDSRNSLVGGSAVQGTWVLYLRGSIYVGDVTHSAQVGLARSSDVLNTWDHVAASRWVGGTCPCHVPQTPGLAPAPQQRECEHRLRTKRRVPRATAAWARDPMRAPLHSKAPRLQPHARG